MPSNEKPKLPAFTFLIGPHGCGKTALATMLAAQNSRVVMASFDEPLREATLSIFFPEQMHLGIDLRSPEGLATFLPGLGLRSIDFLSLFKKFLLDLSPNIFGDLAKRRTMQMYAGAFDHVIYDDTSAIEDMKPFVLAFGVEHTLAIFIDRAKHPIAPYLTKFSGAFINKFVVGNPEGHPEEMLVKLAANFPSGEKADTGDL